MSNAPPPRKPAVGWRSPTTPAVTICSTDLPHSRRPPAVQPTARVRDALAPGIQLSRRKVGRRPELRSARGEYGGKVSWASADAYTATGDTALGGAAAGHSCGIRSTVTPLRSSAQLIS